LFSCSHLSIRAASAEILVAKLVILYQRVRQGMQNVKMIIHYTTQKERYAGMYKQIDLCIDRLD
jgi:hypothetical protein